MLQGTKIKIFFVCLLTLFACGTEKKGEPITHSAEVVTNLDEWFEQGCTWHNGCRLHRYIECTLDCINIGFDINDCFNELCD